MDATKSKPAITPNVYKWGVNMNTNEAVKAMARDFLLSCNLCSRLSAQENLNSNNANSAVT